MKLIFDYIWRLWNYRLFKKTYTSFEDALKDCNSPSSFQQDDLVNSVILKTHIFKNINPESNFPFILSPAVKSILLISSITNQYGCINILDFGGGAGIHYFYFKKIYNKKYNIKWCIVETELMCRNSKFLESDELYFFDSIEKAHNFIGNIDLIFSSGTFQCIPEPFITIDKLLNLNAPYVIFARLNLTSHNKCIISIQKSLLSENGIGKLPNEFNDRLIEYPNICIPVNDFNTLTTKKYTQKIKYNDASGIYKINHYKIFGYTALYELKK